jgi:hypothetical protein
MAANSIRVAVGVDGAAAAGKEIKDFRGELDKTVESTGAQTVLKGVGLGIGAKAFEMIGSMVSGAASAVVDFGFKAVEAASRAQDAMALAEQTFGDSTYSIIAWANSAADRFGTSKTAAIDFASSFGTALTNAGLSMDEAAKRSMDLTERAADLGAAFHTSSEQAANALRSGLLGQTEGLQKFGVSLTATEVKAKALAMGMVPVDRTFTTAQLTMARYQLILEQTAASQGAFGRDSDNLASIQKSLNAQLDDLTVSIGKELLPVAVELAQWARDDLVPALKGTVQWAKENETIFQVLGLTLDNLTGGPVKVATNELNRLAEAQQADTQSAEDLTRAEKERARAHQLAGDAAAKSHGPTSALATPMEDIAKAAGDAAKQLDDFRDSLDRALGVQVENAFKAEQLALKLASLKVETRLLTDHINELNKQGITTDEQRKDLIDTRLRLSQNKEEILKTQAALDGLDGVSLQDILRNMERLRAAGKKVTNELLDAYKAARLLNGITRLPGGQSVGSDNQGGRASGGPVVPFGVYTVGEAGPETLVMGARGGYVVPSGGSGGSGGSPDGGSPVTIQLNLDGRVVAEVVDRELYYRRVTAPGAAVR